MQVDWKDVVDWVEELDRKYGGKEQREMAEWYIMLRMRVPRVKA